MTNIDRIIEFLRYNPGVSRAELMEKLDLGVRDTQVKGLLSESVKDGLVRTEGKARAVRYFITPKAHLLRMVNLDSYYAQDEDHRQVQTGYNFELIRETLPKVDVFTADERTRLAELREVFAKRMAEIPKGAYNREMERLGIDLSWKSAQIEGNTYTTPAWASRGRGIVRLTWSRRSARRSRTCAI